MLTRALWLRQFDQNPIRIAHKSDLAVAQLHASPLRDKNATGRFHRGQRRIDIAYLQPDRRCAWIRDTRFYRLAVHALEFEESPGDVRTRNRDVRGADLRGRCPKHRVKFGGPVSRFYLES